MKTERFDEEFRRKLLGLPAEADSGEVDRIQGFVTANKPALPGFGWGRLWLYVGSSLLLISSLSYNLLQNYRNTYLQSSVDSLTRQPVVQAMPNQIVHDTIYITRSGNTERMESVSPAGTTPEIVENGTVVRSSVLQSDATGREGSVGAGNTKSPQLGIGTNSSRLEAWSHRSTLRSNPSVAIAESVMPNQRREESNHVSAEADTLAATSPITSSDRLLMGKANHTNRTVRSRKPAPAGVARVGGLAVNERIATARGSESSRSNTVKGRHTIPITDKIGLLTTNVVRKDDQLTGSGPKAAGFTSIKSDSVSSVVSISERNRQTININMLASWQHIPSNQFIMISPSNPLVVPKSTLSAKAIRRPWHLTMPTLSVSNAQYRLGVGLTGGSDQVGGVLLGEIMLNRHWSVQTGLQVGYSQGFHYRDEQDFNEHQGENFRQTYAPQVPSSSDIRDINQMTLLVQVPIQVAYHYPFGRQWGLRLGLGTDLNLWGRSVLSFDYRENSRSTEHELSRSREYVPTVNNLVLSTALERSWKKWFFRAGPFISPQFRSVDYIQDDLFWGANLQVLYRLGK